MYNEDSYLDDYSSNGNFLTDTYREDEDDAYEDYEDSFSEDEDEDYEDDYEDSYSEEDEDDAAERRRNPGGRRRRRNRQVKAARGKKFNKLKTQPYRGKGVVNTPAGKANMVLPKDLVRKAELLAVDKRVLANNQAILKNGKAISSLNGNLKRLDRDLSGRIRTQENKISKNAKGIAAAQQAAMFGSLLGGPTIEEVELTGPTGTSVIHKVKVTKSDNTNALLPLMMSGGMGGGDSSNNMMMPMMIMAMQGNDGGSDNSMMMMVMAMGMMGGNKK